MVTSISLIKLDDKLRDRLQNLATIRHQSPHRIMKGAIQDYVIREEAKEIFKQEALESWNSYKKTGKHLTGQEVFEWLDTWGTKTVKPQCHD